MSTFRYLKVLASLNLKKTLCKQFYKLFTENINIEPTAVTTWQKHCTVRSLTSGSNALKAIIITSQESQSQDNKLRQFYFKGARSRYFRQFQHWSNWHRININTKITAQNYRRTRTKHRKDKKGCAWMDIKLERMEVDCNWIYLKNVRPPFFQIYGMSVYTCIKLSLTQRENHSQ